MPGLRLPGPRGQDPSWYRLWGLCQPICHHPPPPPTHTPSCPALAVLSLTTTLLLQNPPAGPWVAGAPPEPGTKTGEGREGTLTAPPSPLRRQTCPMRSTSMNCWN